MLTSQPFRLIKTTPYVIKRYGDGVDAGEFVKGKWVKGDSSEITIDALVYPTIKKDLVSILPEALRRRTMLRIFSNFEFKSLESSGYSPDELTYDGQTYRIWKCGAWINVNGYSGREAYALRIDSHELKLITP